jgi:hypothetical protein
MSEERVEEEEAAVFVPAAALLLPITAAPGADAEPRPFKVEPAEEAEEEEEEEEVVVVVYEEEGEGAQEPEDWL